MKNTSPELPAQVQFDDISADQAGQRIDNYLITRLKGAPKTLVYRILRKGEVRVNKGRVKAESRLKEGDIVRLPPIRVAERGEMPAVGRTHASGSDSQAWRCLSGPCCEAEMQRSAGAAPPTCLVW